MTERITWKASMLLVALSFAVLKGASLGASKAGTGVVGLRSPVMHARHQS